MDTDDKERAEAVSSPPIDSRPPDSPPITEAKRVTENSDPPMVKPVENDVTPLVNDAGDHVKDADVTSPPPLHNDTGHTCADKPVKQNHDADDSEENPGDEDGDAKPKVEEEDAEASPAAGDRGVNDKEAEESHAEDEEMKELDIKSPEIVNNKQKKPSKKKAPSKPVVKKETETNSKSSKKAPKSKAKPSQKDSSKEKSKKASSRKRKASEREDENGETESNAKISEKEVETTPPKAKKAKKAKAPPAAKAEPAKTSSPSKRKHSGKKASKATKEKPESKDGPQLNGELSSTGEAEEDEAPSPAKPAAKKAKTTAAAKKDKSPARNASPRKAKSTPVKKEKKPAKPKPEKKSAAKAKSSPAKKTKDSSKSKKASAAEASVKDDDDDLVPVTPTKGSKASAKSKSSDAAKSSSKKSPSKAKSSKAPKDSKPKETKAKKPKAPPKPKKESASSSKKKSSSGSKSKSSRTKAADESDEDLNNSGTQQDNAVKSEHAEASAAAAADTDLISPKPPPGLHDYDDDDDDDDDGDEEGGDESSKPYSCPECKYRARKKGQLRKHLAVHNIFQCAHCDFTAHERDVMEDHMRVNHPTRCGRKLCKKCNVLFRMHEIEEHEAECTGEKKAWVCKECKKEFKFYCAMKTHYERWHTGKVSVPKYQCEQCEFEASSKASLKQHMKDVHPDTKNVRCPIESCESVFRTDSDLTKHRKKVHEKPEGGFPCERCEKSYSSESVLKKHLQKVHGVTFPSLEFPCDYDDCSEVFKSKVRLIQHKKKIHKMDPPKFKCTFAHCDLEFLKVSHLKRHEVTHTGERKYRCDWPDCGKAFRHADNLRVHYRRHTNEKPLKCDLCGASYRQKTGLKYHMEKAHGTACPPTKKSAAAKAPPSSTPKKQDGVSPKKKKDDEEETPEAEDGGQSEVGKGQEVKADVKTEVKANDSADSSQVSAKDVYDFNDSDDEGLDLKMLPKTPLKGTGSPRIRPEGDHKPLPMPPVDSTAIKLEPPEGKKSAKKKSSKKKKEPAKPKPPKEKKEKKSKKAKADDTSSKTPKETKPKPKSKAKSKKKTKEVEKEVKQEMEEKEEEKPEVDETPEEASPSLVPTPAEENVEEGMLHSESQDEAQDTPPTPPRDAESGDIHHQEEEQDELPEQIIEQIQQETEHQLEHEHEQELEHEHEQQHIVPNDGDSAAGSLENFDDRCDQWVNAPAPQEKPDSDIEEDQPLPPPVGDTSKDDLQDIPDSLSIMSDVPAETSVTAEDISQQYHDVQQRLDSGEEAYTEDLAKAARDLLGETSDHTSEMADAELSAASARDVTSMQSPPKQHGDQAAPPAGTAGGSGEYNPGDLSQGMPGLPAPPAYDVGNYGESQYPAGPEGLVSPQEKVPSEPQQQQAAMEHVEPPRQAPPPVSDANKYNSYQDNPTPYSQGGNNYVSGGSGSERGGAMPASTAGFPAAYSSSQAATYASSMPAATTTTSYSTAGSSFMDSPLYLSSRHAGETTRSLPSAAPFPSPADSFSAPGPRDFFGQYFQDPSTLPLTHPPLSQDQRLSYHAAAQGSSLSALQRSNADLLRRAATGSLMPPSGGYPSVTESLVGMNPGLAQTSQQPWMDSRSAAHWGQPSPILPAPEIDSTSPLARNPYSCERPADYASFDPNNPSSQLQKRADPSFPPVPQSVANPNEPRGYDMASYMGSRGFGGAAGSNYGRSAIPPSAIPPSAPTSASKHLEDAYRHAAHITDYTRSLPQASGVADMYSRMGMNPTAPLAGLDKYNSYWRDPMYRSQHALPGATHPFIPPTTSAAPSYGEPNYGRSAMYSAQHGAYSFMGDKQYLGAPNKVPQGMGAPGHLPTDYLQHATPGAADPHMQDPYRRSVINYMMPRYF